MTALQYIIISACLLLAIFLTWKEIQRPNKARLIWRIITSVLATTSLVFLAIPIYYNTTENTGTNEAVLLTDGYSKDSVDAFLRQNKNTVVYTKDKYEQQSTGHNKLHVFGYGLSTNEWQVMPESNIIFHPSSIGNGITSVGYKKQINSGDAFVVQGRFNNATNKKIKLALSGFGIGVDSVIINPNQAQTFELKTTPKLIGRTIYDISTTINKDTIEHEQLPFEVVSSKPLRILLLAAFPDFENKFLQNWLLQNNYVVAARTTISKNKYSYSYVDTAAFSLSQLTPNILQQFDVLIADATELSSLSRQELFNIKNQINDEGLGLIIKTDSTEKPAVFFDGNCAVTPSSNHNKQTLSIQMPGNDSASALPVENVSFLKMSDDAKPLITDIKNNVLACNALYGNGSIVFSMFTNSYYWALSGDKKSYQLLWSSLIEKAAKKEKIDKEWSIEPSFPVIDQPVEITTETLSEHPLQTTADNNMIAFAAQPYLPFEWKGIYWPTKQGWQLVASSNSDIFWFYVFDKNDWKNVRALQAINDTYAYASSNKISFSDNATFENSASRKTIPAYYFFFVFCCCCIFLWIEKKLS